jgi:hypothetical protein
MITTSLNGYHANGTVPAHQVAPSRNGTNGAAPPIPSPALWGRDGRGRFAPGNAGGPGNPFGKKTAALRKAFLDALSPERIRDLADRLYGQAVAGDLAAAKLVLAYAVGRPDPAPDPDRVDAGLAEIDLLRQLPNQIEVLKMLSQRLGAHQAAAAVRDLLPAIDQTFLTRLNDAIGAHGEEAR